MLIIPVLDLSNGLVVHAKQGKRDHYQPVTSVISSSPDAKTVLTAFLELYPFKTIYIADLDAIQGHGKQQALIESLALEFNQCEFWLDAGLETIQDRQYAHASDNINPVLGSEHKIPADSLSAIIKNNPNIILSLDFSEHGLIENPYLLNDATAWPRKVLVMMIHRVGSDQGIDINCLDTVLTLGKDKDVYSAGGIRNMRDLEQLKRSGVKGVLLASALHNGAIRKEDLHRFSDY